MDQPEALCGCQWEDIVERIGRDETPNSLFPSGPVDRCGFCLAGDTAPAMPGDDSSCC